MSWRTKAALEAVGLDAPHHRSRQATAAELGHAALVIALAPEHVHWVRRTHPRGRRAHGHPASPGPRPARPRRSARRARRRRSALADVELGEWEEVVDPGGGDAEAFAACAVEVVDLVAALAPRLVGSMTQHLTADEAAALLLPDDTLGHAPRARASRPPSSRPSAGGTDWEHLRIGGALLTVLTDLFSHPNVHYLSGFFGPARAPAARQRGQHRLRAGRLPAVHADPRGRPAARHDHRRRAARRRRPVSLSLHAGASVDQLRQAVGGPRPPARRRGQPRASPAPTACGDHVHSVHLDEIDVLIESDKAPIVTEDPPPTDIDRAIAEHVRAFVPDGATLQTGIGAVPSVVASLLAEGDGGGYGIHSEMFTTGLMRLHQAGKVTNHKGTYDGVSVATFAAGTRELYDWLHENHEVAFLPVDLVNSPEVDRPQPGDGDDQRRHGGRHPGPGDRRHDQRRAVLGHRRPRGLRVRPGPGPRRPLAALPARPRSRSATSCARASCRGSTPAR